MRKIEFKEFLALFLADSSVDFYNSKLNTVKRILGNDLDLVVSDFNEIIKAKKLLAAEDSYVRKVFDYYISYHYAPDQIRPVSATPHGSKKKSSAAQLPRIFAQGPIVQYRKDVPLHKRDEVLRSALENEYGTIIQYAMDILQNIWEGDMPYIPVYLSKKQPVDEYYIDMKLVDEIRKKLNIGIVLTDEELDRMRENKIRQDVLGRFFPGEQPYIEIYFNNLSNPYLERANNCLAHEYMHFLHYYYAVQGGAVNPFENEKLNEALADFFGMLYSHRRGTPKDLDVGEDEYWAWIRWQNTDWPYAYALKFFKKPYKSKLIDYSFAEMDAAIKKMRNVFKKTADPATAFCVLEKNP